MRNALYALILLTSLDNQPVWVESSQVIVVRRSLDCAHGHATAVLIQSKALCVKESIDEIREKVKRGGELPPW